MRMLLLVLFLSLAGTLCAQPFFKGTMCNTRSHASINALPAHLNKEA